ncbi:MAG: L-2-amino-thiazoline-4-carboxylic acid hydrolase [Saccharofermentans sp.]|nr:L-2-amino-thiazoline-4-carboxylic acid hydrolase [Saccharofermentans sp.]
MEKQVRKAIIRYLKKHFPGEEKEIIKKAGEILPGLRSKAPDMGGKENTLAGNLDMFLLFLSFYEATDHRMAGEAVDEIIEDLYKHLKWAGLFLNINRKPVLSALRNYLYKSYTKYAELVSQKQSQGEWLETWGMCVNPDNKTEGYAFTLVGCPLVAYAQKYGYMDLIPHMCALDHAFAKLMHAKLIRTHTVATGADSCDYWYVPDKSRTAEEYKGTIL